jgi:Tfp pilus assembly protein PilF
MKTIKNSFLRSQALIQVFLLLCIYIINPIIAHAAANDIDYEDLNKLNALETVIYGASRQNLPHEKRVDALEKVLFGKSNDGPYHPRLFAISSALDGENNNVLSPPLAPGLDRADNDGSLPPTAPAKSRQSDEYDIDTPSQAKRDRINHLLQQAMHLYEQGQINQAETVFKNVLSLDNRNTDANFNLGAIAEGRSDWHNALFYYQQAAKSNPNEQETKNAIASMQNKIANNKQAFSSGTNTKKLSAQQIEALKVKVNQAANDYEKGNYDAAISNLKAVLTQAPDQADIHYALGQAYKAKGDNQQAVIALNQATKLAPYNTEYKDALAELNNTNTPNTLANRATDTFSSNNPNLNSAPEGQLTPFSGISNNETANKDLGWQSTGSSYSGGSYYMPSLRSSYMPGYTYSNYIPYNMSTRVQRAAMGSLAGAAIGSMFGGRNSRGKGAMAGAMIGGMLMMMGR